jgi:serine/threonine protein kinase
MSDTEVELQRIGSYTTTRLLKSDSISSLYLSKQRKKDVVIKVFHAPLITLESKEAFLLRAKQIKKLQRSPDCRASRCWFVQDVDNIAGVQGYLVMQYVPGETLLPSASLLDSAFADEVKRRLSPIASALHYAHVSTTLHGNLHPGNLAIDSKDNALLTDFSFSLQGLHFFPRINRRQQCPICRQNSCKVAQLPPAISTPWRSWPTNGCVDSVHILRRDEKSSCINKHMTPSRRRVA